MPSRRQLIAAGLAAIATPAFAASGAAYRAALEAAYGGPIDPAVAHADALAAARAAQARADVLLRGRGLSTGSVAERLRALQADPRFLYPDTEAGRDQAVAEMNARVAALRPRLQHAFGDLPLGEGRALRMSPADVAAGKGGYREAPADRPGAYYVDLRNIRARPAWTLTTVAFHEVIPGHLTQLPLQAAAHPPAERVKAAAAYFESWAIYAEQLCADLGAYAADPLGEIGYLQWRLFRLARIVVDTGLGAMGWNHDRAIAAVRDLQGFDAAFITIEADVDRIAVTPGKYAAEGLGALALAHWRPKDQARWPAFHRAVLIDGPWPFGELERRLQA
ncbi:DUF885 family protein [Phenylobacterium sp.]|jgi:uncharacterized protein (DUF885 family)|uniref:DUF885 family protein n=1 Tax=Phenylobacterium sp. TaxID=1871053 RepID=UPI002F41B198